MTAPVSRTGATDREVEAAAEAVWTVGLGDGYRMPWPKISERTRNVYRGLARAALNAACAAAAPDSGASLIAAERSRQAEQEGWTPEHDAEHADDAMARAAAVYALPARLRGHRAVPHPGNNGDRGDAWSYAPEHWPWGAEWFKPSTDRVRELVKAGALIAAEIDRLTAGSSS